MAAVTEEWHTPKGPYKLVTVNNAPERAEVVIGRVARDLADRYTIEYVGNCLGKDEVEATVAALKPDLLWADVPVMDQFCASMWTLEESDEMRATARRVVPHVVTHAIPFGLQVNNGPDAVVAHLKEAIPKLLG
ncbi:dynamin family protein [Purpureocillium lavendulum]|uniref:Dynamin family protein n=1 Tax=Purpureocillium lavendulum TaxID=1247861 RepID=A0AB34FV21_9HYPO|nr:dynamin family protein [Purpureocillium lavendulum]